MVGTHGVPRRPRRSARREPRRGREPRDARGGRPRPRARRRAARPARRSRGPPRGAAAGHAISAFVYHLDAPGGSCRSRARCGRRSGCRCASSSLPERQVRRAFRGTGSFEFPGIRVGEPDRHVVWGLTYRFLEVFFRALGRPFPDAVGPDVGGLRSGIASERHERDVEHEPLGLAPRAHRAARADPRRRAPRRGSSSGSAASRPAPAGSACRARRCSRRARPARRRSRRRCRRGPRRRLRRGRAACRAPAPPARLPPASSRIRIVRPWSRSRRFAPTARRSAASAAREEQSRITAKSVPRIVMRESSRFASHSRTRRASSATRPGRSRPIAERMNQRVMTPPPRPKPSRSPGLASWPAQLVTGSGG